MDLGFILLGVVAWGLIVVGVLLLMRMSDDQDRLARRVEKRLTPYSDVTITRV